MKYVDTLTDLIGGTPMLKLNRFAAGRGLGAVIIEPTSGNTGDRYLSTSMFSE